MNKINRLIRNGNISLFVFPCVIGYVLTFYLNKAIIITNPRYGTRISIISFLLLGVWSFLLVTDQIHINNNPYRRFCVKCSLVIILIFLILLGINFATKIWGSGLLTLVPYEGIDNGTQYIDTLYHSAIAESYKRSPKASTLLNNVEHLYYHTFSHLIMGVI